MFCNNEFKSLQFITFPKKYWIAKFYCGILFSKLESNKLLDKD